MAPEAEPKLIVAPKINSIDIAGMAVYSPVLLALQPSLSPVNKKPIIITAGDQPTSNTEQSLSLVCQGKYNNAQEARKLSTAALLRAVEVFGINVHINCECNKNRVFCFVGKWWAPQPPFAHLIATELS